MPRTPGTKIAEGIWRDAKGYTARVKARGTTREARFPLTTSLQAMKDWRDRERGRLKDGLPPPTKGTLARDVVRYMATLPATIAGDDDATRRARALRRERQHQLDWWIQQFPPTQTRTDLDAVAIRAALHGLRAVRSASTCNHYREALYQLWQALDGPDARNPVRRVPRFEEPEAEPREIPAHLVDRLFAAMPDLGRSTKDHRRSAVSLSKIRMRVEYEAGLSPAEIMRIQPRDLHLADAQLYVRRRQKGQGVEGAMLPLTTRAVEALRAFAGANAFGRYATSGGATKVFARALQAVLTQDDLTPEDRALLEAPGRRAYDFRHSFASRALRHTQNLSATCELMRHRSGKTTKRYAKAAVPDHLRQAVATLDAGIGGASPAKKTGTD